MSGVIRPPGYPFSAQELFRALRSRLEAETGEKLTFKRLGQLIGRSRSTAHHWFTISSQPQIIAWFCLLERLSTLARHSLIETHCRALPTLEHPSLAHASAKTGILLELLRQRAGITFVCGATEAIRSFVVTAMGHTYRNVAGSRPAPVGIDVHRPSGFVPVETLVYLDSTRKPGELERLIQKAWPRIQTAAGRLIILNGIWGRAVELRPEILRCARQNHVLVAEAGAQDTKLVRATVSTPVHLVQLWESKRISHGINLNCRRIKPLKRPEKHVLR